MSRGDGRQLELLLRESGIDSKVVESNSCGGGCIADVRRLRLADGRTVIAKISPGSRLGPNHPESRAHEEAADLAAIATTRTVPVPEVIGIGASADDVILVLEDLGESKRPSNSDWIDFGNRLAELHASSGTQEFGLGHDNHLGETVQENSPTSDPTSWSAFLSERRLGPMRRRLQEAGLLDSIDSELFERVDEALGSILPGSIKPGLLHGDLWSGNVHSTQGRGIAVIDPAVFHGDPLFELGMMRLFGGFPSACESTYFDRLVEIEGADALDASETRIELGRLHHLMNHWLLFGPNYGHASRQVASNLVSMISRGGGVG